jgi:hypothetical protein
MGVEQEELTGSVIGAAMGSRPGEVMIEQSSG